MALGRSALPYHLGHLKLTDLTDRIRIATETLYQGLGDAEATAFSGVSLFERNSERTTFRNGTRPRLLTTTAGELELKIPLAASRNELSRLMERRRRIG